MLWCLVLEIDPGATAAQWIAQQHHILQHMQLAPFSTFSSGKQAAA
jgi:hypothetical protein